jgi:hypothetical protein
MSLKIKTKVFFRKKWGKPLTQEDLRGYRNILKLLYHSGSMTPLKDPDSTKYYIQVPSLHLDLIIDAEKAEIVNTKQIYPLLLSKEVTERAVKRIKEEVTKQRFVLEQNIRGKKLNIYQTLYNQIK